MRYLIGLAALVLAGCASYAHIMEYPGHLPGNYVTIDSGNRKFNIKEHPSDSTILMQTTMALSAGSGFVNGFTLGAISTRDIASGPEPYWRAVAEEYFKGTECEVLRVYELMDVSWEATFDCPSGEKTPMQNR